MKLNKVELARLEGNPEEWFKHFFPMYVSAPSAQFQIDGTNRVIANPKWYEVRIWSRGLAGSVRAMLEILYRIYACRYDEAAQVWVISNTAADAQVEIAPYMNQIQNNQRLIEQYGRIECSFTGIGEGQSPCGVRKDNKRPDVLLFMNIDTVENCKMPWVIERRWKWVQETAIAMRSVSEPVLVLWVGQKIHGLSCISRAKEYADYTSEVNLIDTDGNSSWPEYHSNEKIARLLSLTSKDVADREFFNK